MGVTLASISSHTCTQTHTRIHMAFADRSNYKKSGECRLHSAQFGKTGPSVAAIVYHTFRNHLHHDRSPTGADLGFFEGGAKLSGVRGLHPQKL